MTKKFTENETKVSSRRRIPNTEVMRIGDFQASRPFQRTGKGMMWEGQTPDGQAVILAVRGDLNDIELREWEKIPSLSCTHLLPILHWERVGQRLEIALSKPEGVSLAQWINDPECSETLLNDTVLPQIATVLKVLEDNEVCLPCSLTSVYVDTALQVQIIPFPEYLGTDPVKEDLLTNVFPNLVSSGHYQHRGGTECIAVEPAEGIGLEAPTFDEIVGNDETQEIPRIRVSRPRWGPIVVVTVLALVATGAIWGTRMVMMSKGCPSADSVGNQLTAILDRRAKALEQQDLEELSRIESESLYAQDLTLITSLQTDQARLKEVAFTIADLRTLDCDSTTVSARVAIAQHPYQRCQVQECQQNLARPAQIYHVELERLSWRIEDAYKEEDK